MFYLPRLTILVGALLAATLPAGAQELPEGSGKEAVAATCNTCHPLLTRVGSGYTVDGWHTVMRMMVNQGALIPADQVGGDYAVPDQDLPREGKALRR